ncbi:MAG TPA: histidine kinase, partial [Chitinophagaceae bacterium]|nr:histidine kinase [Chitinophagaceae bacterium]
GTISQNRDAIKLPYYRNTINLSFSAPEFIFPERIEYAYQLTGVDNDWKYSNYFSRKVNYSNLQPGNYIFRIKAQQGGGDWNVPSKDYTIIITPPYWQTWWFRAIGLLVSIGIIYFMLRLRLQYVRKQERGKVKHEKELLELEAKALRSQMNPHFIFNCMNSIKSLIQQKDEDKAVRYLTTFSKLLRTVLQNSDKREISLFDEIETCRLYTQLESMRFGKKINYVFNIDESIDLKSVKVPALIIQPYIENAIWHGIMPKEEGGELSVTIQKNNDAICCIIDDDGVGREMSQQNKSRGEEPTPHQSKGVHLTQSRLNLDNTLNERNALVETHDKKDVNGKATGTRVILTFTDY